MDHDKIWKRIIPETLQSCIRNNENKLVIPNIALSNEDLIMYATCLKIPFFRGVFMRDGLPKKIWKNETGIVNLDASSGPGTHWVCYKKLKNKVYYFDSFGNLPPPLELQKYFIGADEILYNYDRMQNFNTLVCGHLCLEFLATSVSML